MRTASASWVRVAAGVLVVQLASVQLILLHMDWTDDSGDEVSSVHIMSDTSTPAHLRERQKSHPRGNVTHRARNHHRTKMGASSLLTFPGHDPAKAAQSVTLHKTTSGDTSNPPLDPVQREMRIINPWLQTRYVCGRPVPPHGDLFLDFPDCHPDDVAFGRVFPIEPSLSGEGMEPTVVRFRDDNQKHHLQNVSCDIPCAVWPSGNPTTKNPATIDGTPFRFVAYSMEGSGIYKPLEVKPLDHHHHHYFATTSFKSDVPLSYYSDRMWNIQSPPVEYEASIKGASFLARNCNSFSNRESLVKELMKSASTSLPSFKIDSLSDCLRNALPPGGVDLKNKTDVMRSYLFHFSFENQLTEDYITEKLWGALASGTVPVYLGAPNVLDHVPSHSIILVNDFSSAQQLISYLTKLAYNQTLYNTYHEWRKLPLPSTFHEKYDFTRTHSHCRICRFSYALKYGWGWDHETQEVLPLKHPRKTCIDEQGWMTFPIQETWNTNAPKAGGYGRLVEEGSVDCSTNSKSNLHIPETHWVRTVWDHDGVTDIEISATGAINHEQRYVSLLRLQMPVNTSQLIHRGGEEVNKRKVYWVQDSQSRVVVVFNETTNLSEMLAAPGSVEFPITHPLRIRLILEDTDTFHEGGDRTESYFGSLMIDEFLHPLKVETTRRAPETNHSGPAWGLY